MKQITYAPQKGQDACVMLEFAGMWFRLDNKLRPLEESAKYLLHLGFDFHEMTEMLTRVLPVEHYTYKE
jgi:hypothetical protein